MPLAAGAASRRPMPNGLRVGGGGAAGARRAIERRDGARDERNRDRRRRDASQRLRPDLPDRQSLGRQGHATMARLAKFEP